MHNKSNVVERNLLLNIVNKSTTSWHELSGGISFGISKGDLKRITVGCYGNKWHASNRPFHHFWSGKGSSTIALCSKKPPHCWCFCSHLISLSLFVSRSVTALLRKLKQQSRESVEDKRPKLLKALKEVSGLYSVDAVSLFPSSDLLTSLSALILLSLL